jgi:hypothetical protein
VQEVRMTTVKNNSRHPGIQIPTPKNNVGACGIRIPMPLCNVFAPPHRNPAPADIARRSRSRIPVLQKLFGRARIEDMGV